MVSSASVNISKVWSKDFNRVSPAIIGLVPVATSPRIVQIFNRMSGFKKYFAIENKQTTA